MRFTTLTALLSLAAVPSVFGQGINVGVHCGTTDDATFSDCQALVDPTNWANAFTTNSVCQYVP